MIIGAIKSLILQLQIVSCAIFDICVMSIVARGPCVFSKLAWLHPCCEIRCLFFGYFLLKCKGSWAVGLDVNDAACLAFPHYPIHGRRFEDFIAMQEKMVWVLSNPIYIRLRACTRAEELWFFMCSLLPSHQFWEGVLAQVSSLPQGGLCFLNLPFLLPESVLCLSWHSDLGVYKGLLNTWNLFTMW